MRKARRFRNTLMALVVLGIGGWIGVKQTVFGLSVTKADPSRYDGTENMAARLKEIAQHFDANRVFTEQVPVYALVVRYFQEIPFSPVERGKILMLAQHAEKAMQRGDNQAALEAFRRVREAAQLTPYFWEPAFHHAVDRQIALTHMRIAEDQNCVGMHNEDSCLFPIKGGGVHTVQDGARAAIAEYLQMLEKHPTEMNARWLLNVAYMTVGEYPEKVPAKWLLPASTLQSDYPLPRFPQVAAKAGVDLEGRAGGVIIDDFDNDGRLDLVVSRMALNQDGQLRFLHNSGDGTFADRTEEAGLTGITGGLHVMQTDYDNDGNLDILVPRGAWAGPWGNIPMSLLRNTGGGHFVDVTAKAGLLSFHPTQTAAWADFDNDGWVDLLVGRETFTLEAFWNFMKQATDGVHDHPPGLPSFKRHPAALYRNNHDGTFTDIAGQAGADFGGFVKGVVAGDYDNDGRMDIYVSRFLESNILLHNEGGMRFTDKSVQAGVTSPMFTFPTFFWDYDNDGWLDIFVGDSPSHLAVYEGARYTIEGYLGIKPPAGSPSALYHNNHDGTFTDVAEQAGVARILLPMGCNFGDLDNDGWLDFYLGTGSPAFDALVPNRMFRNDGGKTFQDVTTAGGFGHLQKGHGVAFGDLDGDGDQDVFAVFGGAFSADRAHTAMFQNPGNKNHFIKLKLEGKESNHAAIGARVRLVVDSGSGTRDIFSTVSSGTSFGSSSFRRELGLGRATVVKTIEVTWPVTGKVQRFENVAADRFYLLREGASELQLL
jgi:hypothetical protein